MGINSIIYISEAIVLAIVLIALIIVFKVKKKNGLLKFLGIALGAYVLMFGATFVLERPEIKVNEIYKIEAKTEEKPIIPATYHFQDVTTNVKIVGNVDYNKIGEYDVNYEIDTLIGKYSKKGKIKVEDTTAPEITLEGGENYNQSYATNFEEPGVKAIDKYDGDISDKIKTTKEEIDANHYNIKYEVEDSSGNKTEKIRKVVIVDNIPPVIDIKGFSNMTVRLGDTYEDKGATAEDEKDGDLTDKIVTEGEVDTSKEGTYKITYKVSDSKGNEAVKERIVNVKQQLVYSEVEA